MTKLVKYLTIQVSWIAIQRRYSQENATNITGSEDMPNLGYNFKHKVADTILFHIKKKKKKSEMFPNLHV